jgi:hypothetical protein
LIKELTLASLVDLERLPIGVETIPSFSADDSQPHPAMVFIPENAISYGISSFDIVQVIPKPQPGQAFINGIGRSAIVQAQDDFLTQSPSRLVSKIADQ